MLQATCDHRGLITSYDYAWPGSVQDSRVFRLSHLWQNKEQYFRDHEFILVDKGACSTCHADEALLYNQSGYPLTKFSIRPFHDHDFTNVREEVVR